MDSKEFWEIMPDPSSSNSFQTFGDLLKYLRRRERLTQLELSITVGYSEAQIGRLEKNQRRPDITALKALFIPALHIENEPELIARFLELAQSARQEDAPAAGIAPYKGLLFFDEADAEWFFGREALTERLADRVSDMFIDASSRFLSVVGASGSGKSSLVRAGLAVALKQSGWDVRIFTPGAYPLKALEMQFEQDQSDLKSERVLLLVDQFEETFTLCHDELERLSFIERLLSLARETTGKIAVVIALRADFYSHCAQYPSLREAVAAEQEYIGQMTAEELRRAIEEPAKHGGWEFEPGLVRMLLNDIGAQGTSEPEPGALPLLSHALLATWERRRGHMFTLDGYQASGGVRGAIAETAESVFTDRLNRSQQELARDVFLRLTELGEGTEDTRRRATLNELVRQSAEATQLRTVLNTLAEARLITLNEDNAEVAHEALIREWQRLHEWLTQDREGLLLHRHITESTHEWQTRGHDQAELYRGARLAQAREWVSINEERLNADEQAFLAASVDQEQRDVIEREAQRQRELEAAQTLAETQSRATEQLRRRAVYLASVLALAIIAALTAGVFASRNSTLATFNAEIATTARANEAIAEQERRAAQQQALISSVRELSNAANLNLEIDPELSILLALQAVDKTYRIDQTVLPEAEEALHRAVQSSRIELTFRDGDEFWDAVFSPDGTRIATASANGSVTVWDAEAGKELLHMQGSTEGGVGNLEFSPNGKLLATAGDDNMARVWDAKTGQVLLTLKGYSSPIQHVTFSLDGTGLATINVDGLAKIWDIETGKELLSVHEEIRVLPNGLAFSPDGTRLAIAAIDGNPEEGGGRAIILDAATGEELMTLTGPTSYMRSISFSPDGTRIVTTSDDRAATIWDAHSGKIVLMLYGHTDLVADAAFSPDGTRIATAGWDRQVKIWDAVTGQQLFSMVGHSGDIYTVAFSPDGTRIITASFDGTARVWNASPSRERLTLVNGPMIVYPTGAKLAYSPDGTRLATSYSDPTAKVWDIATGELLFSLTGHMNNAENTGFTNGVNSITYNLDGTRIATSGQDGTAKIWDAKTGKQLLILSGHQDALIDVAFSPDGARLATTSLDQTQKIWDAVTGAEIFTVTGPEQSFSLSFSPDSSRLAVAYEDTVILWNVLTGKEILTLYGEKLVAFTDVAFSQDGTRLAAASVFDGNATLWDAISGKELFTLAGHTGPVSSVAFSLDSKYIATASADKTAKIWDALTGKHLLTLYASDALTSVAFSPDGSQLATASRDGTNQIYLLKVEELVAVAKQRVTRSLTTEECQQYLHVPTCPTGP
jgi:WD40 repeat protein/transcriptional regulator with XRE-family HTH domain